MLSGHVEGVKRGRDWRGEKGEKGWLVEWRCKATNNDKLRSLRQPYMYGCNYHFNDELRTFDFINLVR